MHRSIALLLAAVFCAAAQQPFPVDVAVQAGQVDGPNTRFWAYFGYDEPNYTYMKNGRKLLTQLADLSPVPVYVRAHCLLNTGDGTPALKWGSTNVYTEDASGNPVYSWDILDRILDTYVDRGMKPLFEIGFMPKDLTSSDMPYQHSWSLEPLNKDIHGAWAYPPKDYDKWAELVYQLVIHCVDRYGKDEVETWLWEPWNEANIGYWRGTQEEYHKLYDYTAAAVKRALPTAIFGGPHWASILREKDTVWFDRFLDHALHGKNFKTGETGSVMDFLAFHAKGRPEFVDGHVRMGLGHHLKRIDYTYGVINSHPELKGKPIIIGESDPEGCAACSSRVYPNNSYRNGTVFSSYVAASFDLKRQLSEQYGINLQGALSWAFEFEDQPWFDGFRALATNGVEKPVLNTFRMFGMMRGDRIASESSHAMNPAEIIENGVRERPLVGADATRTEREVSVMVWHYHDDDVPGPAAAVNLRIGDLPATGRVLVKHYRIDATHSNSYTAWQRMGSPQKPTLEQRAELERAAALQQLEPPRWIDSTGGSARIQFQLPRQGVSLVQVSW